MTIPNKLPRFQILQTSEIEPAECPCGTTRRAFIDDADQVASLHVVESDGTARTHYHRRLTEVYYFLSGTGQVELDGELHDVSPGTAILIKPHCRHRAIGNLRFNVISIPAFDPTDEWFDEE